MTEHLTIYDLIIIGGGPSGVMCGIEAGKRFDNILLIEQQPRLLLRLLASGGGRCNISNNLDKADFMKGIIKHASFLNNSYSLMNNHKVHDYFEQKGVKLRLENGKYYFPQEDDSQFIYDALLNDLQQGSTKVEVGRATGIIKKDNIFEVLLSDRKLLTKRVVLATGGLTYKELGTSMLSYEVAIQFNLNCNHDIKGANVPLATEKDFSALQGISLREISLKWNKVKVDGDLMFAHFGITGPAPIRLSCHLKGNETIYANFSGLETKEEVVTKVRQQVMRSKQNLANAVSEVFNLPKNFCLIHFGSLASIKTGNLTNEQLQYITDSLFDFPIKLKSKLKFNIAFTTDGGISPNELDPRTFMAKKVPGLHFVGESVDLTCYTGGYNIATWLSMGYCCGQLME